MTGRSSISAVYRTVIDRIWPAAIQCREPSLYKRFVEWQKSGLIEKIFHELGEDADLEDISIDSTYIKVHKASAGAERGGGR